MGGLTGISNMGMGSANFMELQYQMQEQMMKDPSKMRELIESPLTRNLMQNPEIMKSLILSNPQLTKLIDRNPEMYDLMGNQEVLQQTMEIARNPELLNELMGGVIPSAGSSGSQPANVTASASLTGSSLYNSTGMQSLMQQMADNPQIMQNMMNAPYTQAMMKSMVENPDMASQIVGSSPLFTGHPGMQEQMRNMMPAFLQQMQNPAVHSLMSNSDALTSLVQIQTGLQTLHGVSPDLYASLGMSNTNARTSDEKDDAKSNDSTSEAVKENNRPMTEAGTGTNSTMPSQDKKGIDAAVAPQGGMDPFRNLMNSMVTRMVEDGLNAPPEERFREQLETLSGMGFIDQQNNIKVLTASLGDVNTAIDKLTNNTRGSTVSK